MCLIERRDVKLSPLNMKLPVENTCVEVRPPQWMTVPCCPTCKQTYPGTKAYLSSTGTPLTLSCKIEPNCLPHPPFLSPPWYPYHNSESPHYPVSTPTVPESPHRFLTPYNFESPLNKTTRPFLELPQLLHTSLNIKPQDYPPIHVSHSFIATRLRDHLRVLKLSGWYYGKLDWQGARNRLKDAKVGSFLIRNSGDRNFYFSLSVQTEIGPTSVRLHFEEGYFRLDSEKTLASYMPRFRSVLELIEYYMRIGERGVAGTVWVDREGFQHSPVLLRAPLRESPPSLLHSARLAIHRSLDSNPSTPKLPSAPKHRLLPLPSILIDYLGEYPYTF